MNVKIYEEKTGLTIFPNKEEKGDDTVVSFFNNSVDLYIEKKGNELRIYCYILARKGLERYNGYYAKSISKYAEDSFTDFKKETNKALHTLELQYKPDDIDNIIFDNIEKFDSDIYSYEDVDVIADVLDSGEYLQYSAGNIDEISIFCKEVLKKIDKVKIAISSEESKYGDINILKNQKREEPLSSSERTRQILDKRREELIEKKRKEAEGLGKERISEGTNLIKEGISILRSAGYEPKEISTEIAKVYKEINANKIKLKDKVKTEKGSKDRSKTLRNIAVILMIISGLLIASSIFNFPFNLDKGNSAEQTNSNIPAVTLPPLDNSEGNIEETPSLVVTLPIPNNTPNNIETNQSNQTNNQTNQSKTNQSNQTNQSKTNQSNQTNQSKTNQSNQTNQTNSTT